MAEELPYLAPVHPYIWGTQYEIRDSLNNCVVEIRMQKFHIEYRKNLEILTRLLAKLMNGESWVEQGGDGYYRSLNFGLQGETPKYIPLSAETIKPAPPVRVDKAVEDAYEKVQEEEKAADEAPDGARLGGDPVLKEIAAQRRGRGRPRKVR